MVTNIHSNWPQIIGCNLACLSEIQLTNFAGRTFSRSFAPTYCTLTTILISNRSQSQNGSTKDGLMFASCKNSPCQLSLHHLWSLWSQCWHNSTINNSHERFTKFVPGQRLFGTGYTGVAHSGLHQCLEQNTGPWADLSSTDLEKPWWNLSNCEINPDQLHHSSSWNHF